MVLHTNLRRLTRLAVASLSVLALWPATPVLAQSGVPRFEKVYTFSASDPASGFRPRGGLIQAADGNLYGVTSQCPGITPVCRGSVFRSTLSGVVTHLHAFQGPDGGNPQAAPLQASDGNFYGTTPLGGASNLGVVYRMLPDGTMTVLHSFAGGTADGATPQASLIQATDGNLYGTASAGGSANLGAIFRISTTGTFALVHSFTGGGDDGSTPLAELVQAPDGLLYGTTEKGGGRNHGVVFGSTLAGSVTVLHTFACDLSGGIVQGECFPRTGLTLATDGRLYGTAYDGAGFYLGGAIFQMTIAGVYTRLWFTGNPSWGQHPSKLVQASDGAFYGTNQSTPVPGVPSHRTLFRITANGTFTVVFDFDGGNVETVTPVSGLIQASDGNLYGEAFDELIRAALSTPISSIDQPLTNTTTSGPFSLQGWAIDYGASSGTGLDGVQIVAAPAGGGGGATVLGSAAYGTGRPDVASAFGSQFTNSGFQFTVSGLSPGTYDITAYPHSIVTGVGRYVGGTTVRVTVGTATSPQMALDAPAPGTTVTQPVIVSGWAIDTGEQSTTGVDAVHVWAFPSGGGSPLFLGAAAYGQARADVGAIYGGHFTNSGFSLPASGLTPGAIYTIVAYAHSAVTGTFNDSRAATVTIATADPLMSVDVPANGSTIVMPAMLSGWAIDLASGTGTGVDTVNVWAQPVAGGAAVFLGAAQYGNARPDVGSLYGAQFTNSGYSLSLFGLAPGQSYDLTVSARSTLTGTFNNVRTVRVAVLGSRVRVAVDTPANGVTAAQPLTIAGWAIDLASATGTGVDAVDIWAHPVNGGAPLFLGSATYGGARPDVGTAFGDARFAPSGFSLTTTALAGGASYDLVVYARSAATRVFSAATPVRVVISP